MHKVKIIQTLWRKQVCLSQLYPCGGSMKILSKGEKPFGLHVWQGNSGILENAVAYPCLSLKPAHTDIEELPDLRGWLSHGSQELLHLASPL